MLFRLLRDHTRRALRQAQGERENFASPGLPGTVLYTIPVTHSCHAKEQAMNIALVTGGSRGLGKSMCLHLAAKGNDLILTYHSNEEQARETVSQIEQMGRKAVALQLDVA